MQDLVKQAQPYLTLVGSVATLALLTFVIHLINLVRGAFADQLNALKAQKEVVDERLKAADERVKAADERARSAEENRVRTEAWHERKIREVNERLARILGDKNLTIETLASGDAPKLSKEMVETIELLVDEIRAMRDRLRELSTHEDDPDVLLGLGQGSFATGRWLDAAKYLEKYLAATPLDWESWYLMSVAYANSRNNEATHRAAVRAMSAALAYAPDTLDNNMRARMLGYRGAMLKRLRRLEEAEADLLLAQKFASADYERSDIAYNLAAVYALRNERDLAMQNVRLIIKSPAWRAVLRAKAEYFATLANDPEFIQLTREGAGA